MLPKCLVIIAILISIIAGAAQIPDKMDKL